MQETMVQNPKWPVSTLLSGNSGSPGGGGGTAPSPKPKPFKRRVLVKAETNNVRNGRDWRGGLSRGQQTVGPHLKQGFETIRTFYWK